MRITNVEQLRDIVGHPTELVVNKVKPVLEPSHAQWLAACPMVFLATSDARGRADVSPKGDPPGKVVHVIDAHTIAIPERPGNKRVDGYLNILENPHVGTISVIPGRGDTLRVNGSARIVDDGDYFDELAVKGKRPILAVEIDIEEVFFHCAKAFYRSNLWKPEKWDDGDLPSMGAIIKKLMPGIEITAEKIDELNSEDGMAQYLY